MLGLADGCCVALLTSSSFVVVDGCNTAAGFPRLTLTLQYAGVDVGAVQHACYKCQLGAVQKPLFRFNQFNLWQTALYE